MSVIGRNLLWVNILKKIFFTHTKDFKFLVRCMVNTIYLFSFVETNKLQ